MKKTGKRLISAAVVLALIFAALPVSALAGANTDYVLQVSRMSYIRSLSGMREDSAEWHAGMEPTENMNGRQVEQCLNDLLDEHYTPALMHFEDMIAYEVTRPAEQRRAEFTEVITKYTTDVRNVRDEIKVCLDKVSYDRSAIYYQLDSLENGSVPSEHEREAIAYEIIIRTKELQEQIRYCARNYSGWLDALNSISVLAEHYNDLYTAEDTHALNADIHMFGQNTDLEFEEFAKYIGSVAQDHAAEQLLISRSIAEQNRTDEQDIVIDVVDVDHFRVYAIDEDKKPIGGATIKCRCSGSNDVISARTNDEGYAEFPIARFEADESRNFDLGYEVTADGRRTRYSESEWHRGGDIIYAVMVKNDPAADVYFAGASLNGHDMLYSSKTVYITPKNDATQSVRVYLKSQSDSTAVPTVRMYYREGEKREQKYLEKTAKLSNGYFIADFSGNWAQSFSIDQDRAFTFETYVNGLPVGEPVSPLVSTKEAAVKESVFISGSALGKNIFTKGGTAAFPESTGLLKNLTINCELPLPDTTLYVDSSGFAMLGFSTDDSDWGSPLAKHVKHWKTADQKELDNAAERQALETGREVDEVKKGIKKQNRQERRSTFLGGMSAYWKFALVVCGNYYSNDSGDDPEDGFLEVGNYKDFSIASAIALGYKGEFTKIIFAGAVPLEYTWGFDVSISTNIQANFRTTRYDIHGVTLDTLIWRFNFNAVLYGSVGVGVTGFSAGGKLSAAFALSFPIIQRKTNESLNMSFTIILSIYVKALFFSASYNIYKGSISYDENGWGEWKDNSWRGTYSLFDPVQFHQDEEEVVPETTQQADDLGSSVIWHYDEIDTGRADQSMPYYTTMEIVTETGIARSAFAIWHSDGKVYYAYQEDNDPIPLQLPEDVQEHLASGEWTISEVGMTAPPTTWYIDMPYGDGRKIGVNVAAITVVCATSTRTEIVSGVQVTVPASVEIITMMYLYDFGALRPLTAHEKGSTVSDETPLIFRKTINAGISNVNTLIHKFGLHTEDQGHANYAIYADSENEEMFAATIWNRDIDRLQAYSSRSGSATEPVTLDIGEGIPEKTVIGSGMGSSVEYILKDNGKVTIVDINGRTPRTVELSTGTVKDIAAIRSTDTHSTLFMACVDENSESTVCRLMVGEIMFSDGPAYMAALSDADVSVSSSIFADQLFGEPILYWYESFRESAESAEVKTRVRGMCYSMEDGMATGAYTLGILEGNDGTKPGFTDISDPIASQVMQDDSIVMTKAWIAGDETIAEREAFSSYRITTVKKIHTDMIALAAEDPAFSAGRSGYLDISVVDRGNCPNVGFELSVYVNENGSRRKIQHAFMNLIRPEDSYVDFQNEGQEGTTRVSGETVIRRIPGLLDAINSDDWNITRSGDDVDQRTGYYQTSALIPGGVHTYSMRINIPANWTGKKQLTVVMDKVYVPDHYIDIFDTLHSVGLQSEAERMQSDGIVYAVTVSGKGTDGEPLTETPGKAETVAAGTLSSFGPDCVTLMPEQNSVKMPEYTAQGSLFDLYSKTAEISISYRLFPDANGEMIISIGVTQEGSTNNPQPRGIRLKATIDDRKDVTYVHTFNTHHKDGHFVYNITLPVSKLTGGHDANELILYAEDTESENYELTAVNNRTVIALNTGLKIIVQPANANVSRGRPASFTVAAEGGTKPYRYQWQVLQDGKWVNIPDADDSRMIIDRVVKRMNGMYVRCAVMDDRGTIVVSDPAKLRVVVPPNTGDDIGARIGLLSIGLALMAVWICICGRRRRGI